MKKQLHIIACCLIGLVSFILMTKDAITSVVFEESAFSVILEEDSEFEKSPLTQVVYFNNRPCIHLSLRPIVYPLNMHYSGQTCIELHSPPPEV